MKHLVAGLVLAWLSIACAQAAVKTLAVQHPTTYTDGAPLPLSDIQRTTFVWGASATAMTSSKVVTGSASSTTVDLPVGTWFWAAKTTAKNTDSALSNIQTIVVPQPPPNPPVAVAEVVAGVTETPAYKLTWAGSRGSAVVGFVPKGTACIGPQLFTYRGLGYRKVPSASVKWWGTAPTDSVAAACS